MIICILKIIRNINFGLAAYINLGNEKCRFIYTTRMCNSPSPAPRRPIR